MVQFSSVDMAVGSIRAGQTDVNIGSLKINIFNHCYKKQPAEQAAKLPNFFLAYSKNIFSSRMRDDICQNFSKTERVKFQTPVPFRTNPSHSCPFHAF